jgi:hypothetical protein
MKLTELRAEIGQHNTDHPKLPMCIYPQCSNKIDPAWDNDVLCREHELLFLYWFYEEDGAEYCPDTWDFPSGKKLPKPRGSDKDMATYRKRYCDWIMKLTPEQYENILKLQIGDEG